MSTASSLPISLESVPFGRYCYELDQQHRAFGEDAPARLALCCEEPYAGHGRGWERRLGPALRLHSRAASLDAAGLREALHYAVHELGVRELVVVLHARCSQLDAPPDPARSARERALPFMERLAVARSRARDQLAAAREAVRGRVRALRTDPELAGVRIAGWVYVEESGAVLELGEDEAFEARP